MIQNLEDIANKSAESMRSLVRAYYEKRKKRALRVVIRHLRNQKKRKPKTWYGKAADFTYKFLLEYEILGGVLTQDMQEKLTKIVGLRKTEYTDWSVAFGFFATGCKYAYAWWSADKPVVRHTSDIIAWWGHFLVAGNVYRYAYLKTKKRPISAPYIWVGYNLPKKALKEMAYTRDFVINSKTVKDIASDVNQLEEWVQNNFAVKSIKHASRKMYNDFVIGKFSQ